MSGHPVRPRYDTACRILAELPANQLPVNRLRDQLQVDVQIDVYSPPATLLPISPAHSCCQTAQDRLAAGLPVRRPLRVCRQRLAREPGAGVPRGTVPPPWRLQGAPFCRVQGVGLSLQRYLTAATPCLFHLFV